jgi:polysaccharide biosynthesis/export protein
MKIWRITSFLLLLSLSLFAQSRKIKPGDTIEIIVYGHQELSRLVSVSPQGTIDFPFLQNWSVVDLTIDELQEVIVAKLSRYLSATPLITVGFAKSNTINVNVLGMVMKPGIIQTPLYSTLQGAISAAGGFAPGARINEVGVMRNDDGKMVSHTYDLEQFLRSNDLACNPILEEGDIVLVSGNPMLTNVKVVGAVRTPGLFNLYTGATILEIIMQAGGPLEDANMSKIIYISPVNSQNQELKIDLLKSLKERTIANLPVVKPGDIIYIPKKKNYLRTILSISRDLTTIALGAYYISRIKK